MSELGTALKGLKWLSDEISVKEKKEKIEAEYKLKWVKMK
jgi:hypothetical protein